jgi:hypothetical protein
MTTSVYLIGGILIQRLYNWVQWVSPIGSRWVAVIGATCIAIITIQMNFTAYFVTYARFTPNMMPISMAYDIRNVGGSYKIYIFGAPRFYADYSVLRFIAPGTERYNVEEVEQLPSLTEVQENDRGILVILLPHRLTELERVAERFPGGTQQEHLDRVGNLMYVTYELSNTIVQQKSDTNSAVTTSEMHPVVRAPSQESPLPYSPLEPPTTPTTP